MAVEPRQDLLHGQNQTRPRKGASPSQAAGYGPVWASVLELDGWAGGSMSLFLHVQRL